MSVRIVIAGCGGRMGRAIGQTALQDHGVTIAGAFEVPGHALLNMDYGSVLGHASPLGVRVVSDARQAIGQGDVVIEFTAPEPTLVHLDLARALRKPMVIGTTGLSEAQIAAVKSAAQAIPIVFSPNMSLGVNLLFELSQLAAQRLGLAYDVEVVEAHHRQKKDAPSGTAKRLAEGLASARKKPVNTIPVHAVRAGDIVGDHTVILAGPAERLELTHRAHSREVFARGAITAAQFVATQKPGLYDMSHVLRATS